MVSKKRILCVDDEYPIRVLLKHQLEGEGYEVETADDGDVAIRMLEQSGYDILLLDIRMQRVSGINVLRRVKELGLLCRVIMLTAVDDLSVAVECVKLGANDYLTKPFDTEALLDSIRRVSAV